MSATKTAANLRSMIIPNYFKIKSSSVSTLALYLHYLEYQTISECLFTREHNGRSQPFSTIQCSKVENEYLLNISMETNETKRHNQHKVRYPLISQIRDSLKLLYHSFTVMLSFVRKRVIPKVLPNCFFHSFQCHAYSFSALSLN